MKVRCHDCGLEMDKTKDELIGLGWCGASGDVNGIAFKFELCPKHNTPERTVEIMKDVEAMRR